MEYTYNSDPAHYEINCDSTNCGSYALRLNEWYALDADFADYTGWWVDEWISDKSEEGYSDYEIACLYGEILIECMLNEFGDELEICDGRPPETDDKELIALNTFCDTSDFIDSDFHFKVFRDGEWKEKCGILSVRTCEKDEWGIYDGDVIYLYHKIKGQIINLPFNLS